MRILLTASFVVLVLASTSAQQIGACPRNTANLAAVTAEAESGNPQAQLTLGQAYFDTKDPEKLPLSVYWIKKAAEQGYANAEMRLAGVYGAGQGVVQDDNSALFWLNRAAEDGQAQAQWALGIYYRDGRGVERNELKAFDLFLRAAKQGDVDAQVAVAQMYEDGDSVPQDYQQTVSAGTKRLLTMCPNTGCGCGPEQSRPHLC